MRIRRILKIDGAEDALLVLVALIALFWVVAQLLTILAENDSAAVNDPVTQESIADEKYRTDERKKMETYMSPEWQNKHEETRVTPIDEVN